MSLSFRGEFSQKVDSKGRMSIPADFRRVLEDGDPEYPEKRSTPRMVVLYGPHLKNCLHVYTIEGMARIEKGIKSMKSGTPERKRSSRFILNKSWETDTDRDGRIVVTKDRRQQIALQGEAIMAGMGDYFELWNAATFRESEAAEIEAYLDEMPDGYDPLSEIPDIEMDD